MRPEWSLDPAVVHLNHGSFGAVPVATQQRQQLLREQAERNPMQWFRERADRLVETKQQIADYLATDPHHLALVPNASTGATIALTAIRVTAGQRFVITDHVYGAIRRAVERVAARAGCIVEVVPIPLDADDDEVVRRVLDHVDDDTACVAVDQITSSTAKLMPVGPITAACRERGVPVVVDGAHAPGLVDNPVAGDFWTGNLHKWPCAPRGTAVLHVGPAYQHLVEAPTASWLEGEPYPAPLDLQGTVDDTGWFAAPTSLDLMTSLGLSTRRAQLSELVDAGAATIAAALGQQVLDVGTPAPTMRLVSLPDGLAADELTALAIQARLAEQTRVEVAMPVWRGRAYLRISCHLYNEPADYELAAQRYAEAFSDIGSLLPA